uniref:EF-hand domain-containing protein n=1 Tax=Acrobeloides nanus TaxID=290746 RepID=A0A914CBE5_9BILA
MGFCYGLYRLSSSSHLAPTNVNCIQMEEPSFRYKGDVGRMAQRRVAFKKKKDDSSEEYELDEEDLQRRKVKDVLEAFSQERDDKIDASEISNIFRSLKINITQEDLSQIENQVFVKINETKVSSSELLPRLLQALEDEKWLPYPPEILEAAFQAIENDVGVITKDKLRNLMTTRGEPLNDVELKEMLSHLSVRRNGNVDWKYYIHDFVECIRSVDKLNKKQ